MACLSCAKVTNQVTLDDLSQFNGRTYTAIIVPVRGCKLKARGSMIGGADVLRRTTTLIYHNKAPMRVCGTYTGRMYCLQLPTFVPTQGDACATRRKTSPTPHIFQAVYWRCNGSALPSLSVGLRTLRIYRDPSSMARRTRFGVVALWK
jgi:hypothetical protein